MVGLLSSAHLQCRDFVTNGNHFVSGIFGRSVEGDVWTESGGSGERGRESSSCQAESSVPRLHCPTRHLRLPPLPDTIVLSSG